MKKLLSVLMAVMILLSFMMPAMAEATKVEIKEIYADGDIIYVTAEILGEFESAALSLAGIEKGSIAYVEGKSLYSFSGTTDYLGNIEAKITAGSSYDSEKVLVSGKSSAVDYSANLNTFENKEEGTLTVFGAYYNLDDGNDNTRAYTTAGKSTATVIKNLGTNSGMSTIFERLTGDNCAAYIRKYFATGTGSSSRKRLNSGVAEIKFDAYMYNQKGDVSVYPRPESSSAGYWMFDGETGIKIFGNDGFIAGTDIKYDTEKWYSARIIIDLDNEQYAVIVNNELIKTGSATVAADTGKLFYFDIYAGEAKGQKDTKVAFDNTGVESYSKAAQISSVKYKNAAGDMKETDVLSPSVYFDTEQIDITFSSALDSPDVAIDAMEAQSDVNGNTISVFPELLSESTHCISIASASLSKDIRIYFDAAKETGILSPINGSTIGECESVTLKAMAPGAAKVKFFVDSSEYEAVAGEGDIFTAVVPASEIAFGKRKVTMRCEDATGIEEMQTVYFTYSKDIVKNEHSSNLDAFTSDKETISMSNGTFVRSATTALENVSETNIAVYSNAYTARTTMSTLNLSENLTGTIVFEHEVKFGEESAIGYEFKNSSGNAYFPVNAWTWGESYVAGNTSGSKYSVSDNGWHKLKITVNTSNYTWNVFFDGVNVIKDVVASSYTDRFTDLKSIVFKAVGTVSVDNPKVYNVYPLPKLTNVSYDGTDAFEDCLIPASAKSISVEFDTDFYALENTQVTANGNALSNVVYENKVLKFDMPASKAHEKVTVKISGDAQIAEGVTLGNDIDVTLYIANGELLYIEKSTSTSHTLHKGIISAINGGDEVSAICVFGSYKDENALRMTSVDLTTLTIPSGESIISRAKEAASGEWAKIFIWDNTDTLAPLR